MLHQHEVALVIEKGQADNVQVVVNDSEAYTGGSDDWLAAFARIRQRYARLPLKQAQVHVVLGSDYYQAVAIDRPNVAADELAASLRWSLRDLVSLAPQQMVVDYYELPYQPLSSNKVVAVVADRQLLMSVIAAVADADMLLHSVGIFEHAVAALFLDQEQPLLLFTHSAPQQLLCQIIYQGKLTFSRQLRAPVDCQRLSAEEIELGALDALSIELQRSMDYVESQLKLAPVQQILVMVSCPQQALLVDKLHQLIGVATRYWSYPASVDELAAGDYSDVAGLGGMRQLREMLRVEA
ncbi:hypothetical protein [Idiomarina xiamenensis]|uniref:hypothetical protein n=1 Tax=Idiomarina xiamenensis TaxID=1207041 RepID=UPI0002EA588A|nr:hypothetical protein [Idiomarina xiamenensis]